MALSTYKIEAIRQGIDILTVVGRAVELKKRGARWLGLCPFHAEKTPSFSVSIEKGLYYCFGCHAGGDVFSFIMRHEGLDFHSAVRHLARDAGVELEAESPEVMERRKRENEAAKVNGYAQAFFLHALWAEEGGQVRAYVAERGISEELAREMQLGCGGAPGQLLAYLEAKKVPQEAAAAAGLLSEEGRRGLFDARLTFPIFDLQDRLCGFGGRKLTDAGGPKYVNSRESVLFSKRRLLYGLKRAREAIRRGGRVVVVEGYMDVLACQASGVPEAVAALGTALTEEHARDCARFAKEAILLFDGDDAGQRASREATEKLISQKLKTLTAPLSAGADPDSLVRESGADALRAHLDAAVPAVEHFIQAAFRPGMSIEDRAEAAKSLAPLIDALGSGLERDLYTARLAEQVGISVEQLKRHLTQALAGRRKRRVPPEGSKQTPAPGVVRGPQPSSEPASPRPERGELKMLQELLLFADLRPRVVELSEYASDPMRVIFDDLGSNDEPVAQVLERHLPAAVATRLAAIGPAEGTGEGAAEQTFQDILSRLKENRVAELIGDLDRQIQEKEARGEDAEDEIRRRRALTQRKRELKGPRSTA